MLLDGTDGAVWKVERDVRCIGSSHIVSVLVKEPRGSENEVGF